MGRDTGNQHEIPPGESQAGFFVCGVATHESRNLSRRTTTGGDGKFAIKWLLKTLTPVQGSAKRENAGQQKTLSLQLLSTSLLLCFCAGWLRERGSQAR